MRIIDNSVICIRSNTEQYDYFEQQSGIKIFPKREMFTVVNEELLNGFNEPRIIPELRQKNLDLVAHWVTHTAILETFLKNTTKKWLYIIEDKVEFSEHHINLIEASVKPGFNKLESHTSAYIVDRETANIITRNAQIYYAPYDTYISDLAKLGLIQLHENIVLKKLSYPFLYDYFPVLVIFLLLFLYIGPLYRIFSKLFEQLIGFTKMFTAKITSKG
jgi:hypothetical protein